MSVGFIQLGQCGNQLGQSFYQYMINECQNASPAAQALVNDIFFFQDDEKSLPTAKALLIDMEPKVVNNCLNQNHDGFQYSKQLSFTKQEGSGNNWAYGYNSHGPKTEQAVLDRMDTLLEKTDYMEGFFLMSSLAGGTGSGVGSYVQKTLTESYPELNFLNICVVPHLTGEVILQSLNSTLTLSHLQNYSQGIIMLSNDEATESCDHLLGNKRPSLNQINELMSSGLASLFWPAISGSQNIFSTLQNGLNYFNDIINTLLLDTRYKLLQLRHVPQMAASSKAFTNDTWISLEKRICQMTMTGTREYNINWNQKAIQKTNGALMIARGNDNQKHDFQLTNSLNYKLIKDNHQMNGNDKSICCLHNSQSITSYLDILAERSTQMIKEKAYLYQYQKFGVDKEHFLESIAVFESIIQNYQLMQ